MGPQASHSRAFEDFLAEVEPGLRHALVAIFGPEDGRDAAAQALLYGWENWDRLSGMKNPAGYLFRVGQTSGRRSRRTGAVLPLPPLVHERWVEPSLPKALAELSDKQRVAVVLRHGSDWSYSDIARLMETSQASVRKSVERGLARLRVALEVNVES